jgi:hypothetical protein
VKAIDASTAQLKLERVTIRSRTRWWWICGALAGAAIFAAIIRTNGEPSYEGRPLSFWLDQLTSGRSVSERSQAQLAITQIGTNALPVLLTMLAKRDSKARQTLQTLLDRQFVGHFRSAAEYHLMARNGFCVLGRMASPVESQLAKLSRDKDPDISRTAGEALLDVSGGFPFDH